MKELRARLYGRESSHFGNCVQAAVGKFVLVKYGAERIAFKFTEPTTTGDGGAKYAWFWQPKPTGPFQAEPFKSGVGEAFEKYRKVKSDANSTMIENDGGQLYLKMGPAKLDWSKPFTVYYTHRSEDAPNVVFALTPWERIEQVNFDDQSLNWYEKRTGIGKHASAHALCVANRFSTSIPRSSVSSFAA